MRSLLRSLQAQVTTGFASAKQWITAHKYPLGFFALICCLLFFPHTAQATLTDDALSVITTVISWVVTTLGQIFIFLVDIFLGFARYNDFGNALPVKIGWVIVRDICNMFFIVVLLISAFNTIIGWDSSLRYNTVLPKLLGMAILINFSRTFILLLVDFSQVVMLTFVNAFRAAGAGNFINAFRINQLMSMSQDTTAAATDTTGLAAEVFASYLLALVLIVIANGVMLIMIAYVLGRIILLWVLLIFSPAAFFVTALPSKLQAGIGSFGSKYWSRLGGALTGGPIVMFFIYLTFAILQSPPTAPTTTPPTATTPSAATNGTTTPPGASLTSQLNLYSPPPDINGVNATTFLTRVGTSDNVASFIVAVALMLMALDAAMESAKAVDSSIGAFASKVGSASKGLAYGAATLAATSPWLAAKFLGKGAYNTLDRRYDMTGKASGLALRVANRVPVLGQYARKPLMTGMTMRKKEAEKTQAELISATKGMSADQKRIVQKGYQSWAGGALAAGLDKGISLTAEDGLARKAGESFKKNVAGAWYTRGDKMAAEALAMDMTTPGVDAQQRGGLEDKYEQMVSGDNAFGEKGKPGTVNGDGHAGKLGDSLADDYLRGQEIKNLAIAKKEATRLGDTATLNQIADRESANPLLIEDDARFAKEIGKKAENTEKYAKMDAAAKANVKVLMQGLVARGVVAEKGDEYVLTGDEAKRKSFMADLERGDKTVKSNTEYLLDYMDNNKTSSGGKGMMRDKARATRLANDKNGNMRMWANPSSNLSKDELAKAVTGGLVQRSSQEGAAIQKLGELSKNNKMSDPAAIDAVKQFFASGGLPQDLQEQFKGNLSQLKPALDGAFQSVAANLNSSVSFTNDQLQVNPGQQESFQKSVKEFSQVIKHLGKTGVSNDMSKMILDGMKDAKIAAPNGAGGTQSVPLGDVFAYKSSFSSLNNTKLKTAGMRYFTVAAELNHNATLETAKRLSTSTDKPTREKLASPINQILNNAGTT